MAGTDGIRIYHGGAAAQAWIECYRGKAWQLAIALGFTETALIPGISAAGKTPGDRRFTAIADAEFLQRGLTQAPSRPLPPLTAGLSPVLLSRALLEAAEVPAQLINTGLASAMTVPALELGQPAVSCLSTGHSMARSQAEALFELGLDWGARWPESGLKQCFSSAQNPRTQDSKAQASKTQNPLATAPDYAVLGECVVGGTSTALAVLIALGLPALRRVNSSHSECNHLQKAGLVALGLARSGLAPSPPDLEAWLLKMLQSRVGAGAQRASDISNRSDASNRHVRNAQVSDAEVWQRLEDWLEPEAWRSRQLDPLSIVAAVGDPMQPFLAGCTLSLSRHHGVLLAGGTQMLAVYALAAALAQARELPWSPEKVAIGTTAWVADDPTGDTVGLATAISKFVETLGQTDALERLSPSHGAIARPTMAECHNQPLPDNQPLPASSSPILLGTQLNFDQSQHAGLRAYEAGFVKEGVAAGGCAIATSLSLGWSEQNLAVIIEDFVERYGAWRNSQ